MDQPETSTSDDMLMKFIRRSSAHCPVCGYDLRASTEARCTECGATLELRVGSADLRLGPWLLAIVASAMPLGLFTFLLAISAVHYFTSGRRYTARLFAVLVFATGVYAVGLLILIRLRRRFWAVNRALQWRFSTIWFLIALVCGFTAISFLIFI